MMNRLLVFYMFFLILLSINLLANAQYETYHEENGDTFAKVYGINEPIKLHIGTGKPQVLSLLATENKDIKLLKCFGGDIGTSVLVGYYYTYILDFKKKKIIGSIEYYDDYGYYTQIDKKPKWVFKKDIIEVSVYDDERENYKKILFYLK